MDFLLTLSNFYYPRKKTVPTLLALQLYLIIPFLRLHLYVGYPLYPRRIMLIISREM